MIHWYYASGKDGPDSSAKIPWSGNTSLSILQMNISDCLSVLVTRSFRPLCSVIFDLFDADRIISAAPCAALIATSKILLLSIYLGTIRDMLSGKIFVCYFL